MDLETKAMIASVRSGEWEHDLVRQRAWRMRFRGSLFDEAVDTVKCHVAMFRFDASKANGANLRTVLCAVIDRRLKEFFRGHCRRSKRMQTIEDLPEGSYVRKDSLKLDVMAAIATLSPEQKCVCERLADGMNFQELADELGCDWHTVERRVLRIRKHFAALGLDGWLDSTGGMES
jgi:RNA polymerase sigma factor (sigma-70 family)